MKATLHVIGADYRRISTHVRFGVRNREVDGFVCKFAISPWSMRGNGREIILHLLKKVRWRISWKSSRAIILEAEIPDKIVKVIEMIYDMPRVTKANVEKWKSMSVEALYDELLPLIVADNLKQH